MRVDERVAIVRAAMIRANLAGANLHTVNLTADAKEVLRLLDEQEGAERDPETGERLDVESMRHELAATRFAMSEVHDTLVEPGDLHTCSRCGATSVAIAHDLLPDDVRQRIERSREITRSAMARSGRALPPQPETAWRRVSGPTKAGPYR